MDPIVFIPLTMGKVAVVDFADFELVRQFKWFAAKRKNGLWYAARNWRESDNQGKGQTFIHNEILGRRRVDHRNGNGLDNRRSNIRGITHAENCRAFKLPQKSTSKFRGVCWDPARNKWAAFLGINGKHIGVGRFVSEEEAARAWDAAALKHGFFEEALNFPPPRPDNFTVL